MGAVVRDCFVVANAWSSSGDHRNSFLVLSRDRRGRPATVGVLDHSWLTNPKKARRSVRFVGVGKLETAVVIDWSIQ